MDARMGRGRPRAKEGWVTSYVYMHETGYHILAAQFKQVQLVELPPRLDVMHVRVKAVLCILW